MPQIHVNHNSIERNWQAKYFQLIFSDTFLNKENLKLPQIQVKHNSIAYWQVEYFQINIVMYSCEVENFKNK